MAISYAQLPYGKTPGIRLFYGDTAPEDATNLAYVQTVMPPVVDVVDIEDDLADPDKYTGNALTAAATTLQLTNGQIIDPSTGQPWVVPTDNVLFTTVTAPFTTKSGAQVTIPLFYCQELRFPLSIAQLPAELSALLSGGTIPTDAYYERLALDSLVSITLAGGAPLPAGYLFRVLPGPVLPGQDELFLSVYTNFKSSFRQRFIVHWGQHTETLNVHPIYFQSLTAPNDRVYLATKVVDNSIGALTKSASLTGGASSASIVNQPGGGSSNQARTAQVANTSSPQVVTTSTYTAQSSSIALTTDNPYFVNGPSGYIVRPGTPTTYATPSNTAAPQGPATALTFTFTTLSCSSDANGQSNVTVTLSDPTGVPVKTWRKLTATQTLSFSDPNAVGGIWTWTVQGTVDDSLGIAASVPAGQYNYTCSWAGNFGWATAATTVYANQDGATATYATPSSTVAPVNAATQLSLVIASISTPQDPYGASSYSIALLNPSGSTAYSWTGITAGQTLTYSNAGAAAGSYTWSIKATCTNTGLAASTYNCNLTATQQWYVSVPGTPTIYANQDGAKVSYTTGATTLAPISANTQLSLTLSAVTVQSDVNGASSLKVQLFDPSGKALKTWANITAPQTFTYSNLAAMGGQYTWKVWAVCTNTGTAISTYNDTWTGTQGWYEPDPTASGNSKQQRPIGFMFATAVPDGTIYGTYDDGPQIYAQEPDQLTSKENWYLRLHRGWLSYTDPNNHTYLVGVEPYYQQNFDEVMPVITLKRALCSQIAANQVQLPHTPVLFDKEHPLDVIVTRRGVDLWLTRDNFQASGDYVDTAITDVDAERGIVTLANNVIFGSDTVHAKYSYLEYYFVYRGFPDQFDRFIHLDLNPAGGHTWMNLWNIENIQDSLAMIGTASPSIIGVTAPAATNVAHTEVLAPPVTSYDTTKVANGGKLYVGSTANGLTITQATDATYGTYTHVVGSTSATSISALLWGPYANDLTPGTYDVYFRARVSDNTSPTGWAVLFDSIVDNADGKNGNAYVKWTDFAEPNTWQQFKVTFTLQPGYDKYETRAFWQGYPNGTASLDIANVEVYPTGGYAAVKSTAQITAGTQSSTANVAFSSPVSDAKTLTTTSSTSTSAQSSSQVVTDSSTAVIAANPVQSNAPALQQQAVQYTGQPQIGATPHNTLTQTAQSKTVNDAETTTVTATAQTSVQQVTTALSSATLNESVSCQEVIPTGPDNWDRIYWACKTTSSGGGSWPVNVPIAPIDASSAISFSSGPNTGTADSATISLYDPNGNLLKDWSCSGNQTFTYYAPGAPTGTYTWKLRGLATSYNRTDDQSSTSTFTITPSWTSLQNVTTTTYGSTNGSGTKFVITNAIAPTTSALQLSLALASVVVPSDANGSSSYNVQLSAPNGAIVVDQHGITAGTTLTYSNAAAATGTYTWTIWASAHSNSIGAASYNTSATLTASWQAITSTTTYTYAPITAQATSFVTGKDTLAPTGASSQLEFKVSASSTPSNSYGASSLLINLVDPSGTSVGMWTVNTGNATPDITYSNAGALAGSYTWLVTGECSSTNTGVSQYATTLSAAMKWYALQTTTNYTYSGQNGATSTFVTDPNTVAPTTSGTQLSLTLSAVHAVADSYGTPSFSVRLLSPSGTTVGAWDNIVNVPGSALSYYNAGAVAGAYTWQIYAVVAPTNTGTSTYACTWTGTFASQTNVTSTTYNTVLSPTGSVSTPASTVAPVDATTQISFAIASGVFPTDSKGHVTVSVAVYKQGGGSALQSWNNITSPTTLTYSATGATAGVYIWQWNFTAWASGGTSTYTTSFTGSLGWYQSVTTNATVYLESDGAMTSLTASATAKNQITGADTLAGFTIPSTGTTATGGPSGSTDYEYTGTGVPVGSPLTLAKTVPVVPGLTYTPSFWFDASQLIAAKGTQPNVLTEFAGSTQNADGTYSNVHGKTSATAYTFAAGQALSVSLDVQSANSASNQIQIGTSSNNYRVTTQGDGNFVFYKNVNSISSNIWCSHTGGNNGNNPGAYPTGANGWSNTQDTAWHTMRFTVIASAYGNVLIAQWDNNYITATDYSLNLTNGTWPVSLNTYSSTGKIRNYTINGAAVIGLQTGDGFQQIAQQPVILTAAQAQRFAMPSWTCPTNLAPHSDDLSSSVWTINSTSTTTLAASGPAGAEAFVVTGTGSPITFDVTSSGIPVTPGQVMSASIYVDASCTFTNSGETARLIVFDLTNHVEFMAINFTSGQIGRIAGTFIVPQGCTSIRLQPHTASTSFVIASGKKMIISQPMLTTLPADPGYYISSQTPQVRIFAQLLPNASVYDNLVPNSSTLTGWTNYGAGATATGGPGGAADWEIGTVGATFNSFTSPNFSVKPGMTYVVSSWCDPSQVTAIGGYVQLTICDVNGSAAVGATTTAGAAAGRISIPYTIPVNLAPNSDSLSGWMLQGSGLALGTGGPNSVTDAEVTGTGAAFSGIYSVAYNMSITPGASYIPSFWLDQTYLTAGSSSGSIGLGDITGFGSFGTQTHPAFGAGPNRYAGNLVTLPVNLCPEAYTTWTMTGSAASSQQTTGGATYQRVNFTTNADTATSPSINVTAGTQYSLSAQIVGSITAGSVIITAKDQNGAAIPGLQLSQTANSFSRLVQSGFTIPAGVTSLKLVANANGATFTGTVNVQTIMFTQGATDPGGYISTNDPRVQVFYEVVGPTVTSGQKLKIAQPMLAVSGNGMFYVSSQNPQINIAPRVSNITCAAGGKLKFSQPMLEGGNVASSTYYAGAKLFKIAQPMLQLGAQASSAYVSPSTAVNLVAPTSAATQLTLALANVVAPNTANGASSFTVQLTNSSGIVKTWTGITAAQTLTYWNAGAPVDSYVWNIWATATNGNTGTATLVASCNATATWTQVDQVPKTTYTLHQIAGTGYESSSYTVAPKDGTTALTIDWTELVLPKDAHGATSLTVTITDSNNTQVKQWTGVTTTTPLTWSSSSAISGPYTVTITPVLTKTDTGTGTYAVYWSATMVYQAAETDNLPTYLLTDKNIYCYLTVDGYPFHAVLDPLNDPTLPLSYDTNNALSGTRYAAMPTIHAF